MFSQEDAAARIEKAAMPLNWKIVAISSSLCGVFLLAALLTLPVAGTALYIVDEYLNPRSFSAATVLLAVLFLAQRRWAWAGVILVLTAAVHPLMTVFGFAFAFCWWLAGHRARRSALAFAAWFPLSLFPPVTGAYREALRAHSYFSMARWEWYEWLGMVAPVVLFWWFARIAKRERLPLLERLCRASVWYGGIFSIVALFTIPEMFERFLLLQPMRHLHLLYMLLLVVSGGLLNQFVMKSKAWRWAVLLLALCGGMFYAQRQLFPATPHLELPGAAPANPWVEAFLWVRGHTPNDAVFALDPDHMSLPGEDQHGFRAIAERSMLADGVKDEGAVTMFPKMADDWKEQVTAQTGWKTFQMSDFQRLQARYGVNWVIVQPPAIAGLDCPYANQAVAVCRLP